MDRYEMAARAYVTSTGKDPDERISDPHSHYDYHGLTTRWEAAAVELRDLDLRIAALRGGKETGE